MDTVEEQNFVYKIHRTAIVTNREL